MCFSSTASFTAAGVISVIGIFNITQIRTKRQVMLGIIPFHFAFHQFIEGLMWVNLQTHGSREMSLALGYLYTFLSGFVWPIWMPACLIPLEKEEKRKKWLYFFTFAGLVFSTYSYHLILKGGLEPRILGGHIDYTHMTLLYFLVYCLISITPFFIIKIPCAAYFKIFGTLLFASFLAGYIVSIRCAASIWCFFAAISSLFITSLLMNLNKSNNFNEIKSS